MSYCKKCDIDIGKNRRLNPKSPEQILLDRQNRFASLVPTGILKHCNRCKSEKDESEFHIIYSSGQPERFPYCKICSKKKKF